MDKSVQRQIREIANNAITEISRISQLVTHSAAASNQRSSSTSSPLSSGSASSALPSGSEWGSSSRSSGSLVSELHRRFRSMQGTTHRGSTPTSSGRGRSNSTQRVGAVHRMSLPSKTLLLWVYSVKKHQQLARKRSVSSIEIVL